MTPRQGVVLAGAAALALGVGALGACQSTQDKSAELSKGASTLISDKGLRIKKESTSVTVLSETVLPDEGSAAVVIELANDSGRALANVPLLIELEDADGKDVYANDVPGLDPTLISVPVMEPGEEVAWVNDQITYAGADPVSVKATVGETSEAPPADLPEVTLGPPELKVDQISGVEAVGTIDNTSDELIPFVYFYAVAREGNEIVAAGRGAFEKLKPDYNSPREYHIFFKGDPEGSEITVKPMPTVPNQDATGP